MGTEEEEATWEIADDIVQRYPEFWEAVQAKERAERTEGQIQTAAQILKEVGMIHGPLGPSAM